MALSQVIRRGHGRAVIISILANRCSPRGFSIPPRPEGRGYLEKNLIKLVGLFGLITSALLLSTQLHAVSLQQLPMRQKVVETAQLWLDQYTISYAWGGSQLGDDEACQACNDCVSKLAPAPRQQLETCPVCRSCSLDCSHFVSLVFRDVGLTAPYLTTSMMRQLDDAALKRRFAWLSLGRRVERVLPGDLLVYDGHVVMVTAVQQPGQGDVIHVTSGRELRGPGKGLQRERSVEFDGFRGPVERVLRHRSLHQEWQKQLQRSQVIQRVE